MKRKLKITAFTILGTLVLAEIVLRVFFHVPLQVVRVIRPLPYLPDSVINFTYIPNSTYVHGQSGVEFRFNNEGFIGKDILPKDSTKYRIIFVGSSIVSSDLKNEYYSTFSQELEKIIEKKGDRIEIINCAVDGMTPLAYHKIINYKVKNYQPDLVLSLYGLPFEDDKRAREQYRGLRIAYLHGDYKERDRLRNVIDTYREKYEKWFHSGYKSALFKAFLKLQIRYRFLPEHIKPFADLFLFGQISTKKGVEVKYSLEDSIEMELQQKKELSEEGIGYFLFALGNTEEAFRICKEHKLPLIPLSIKFEPEDYFPSDHHYNRAGNTKIAEKLYSLLTGHVVPQSYLHKAEE